MIRYDDKNRQGRYDMDESKQTKSNLWLKYKSSLIKIIIIAAVLLIVVLSLYFKGYMSASKKYKSRIKELEEENKSLSDPIVQYEIASKEVNIELIKSEIQDIGELATVEYLYTDAGKFEDPAKLFGKEIPFSFTTKSFIAKWDGIIKAGIHVEEVTVEVNNSSKEIVVHMPGAEILSHELDEESIETLDEKNGLFNSIKVDDIREFDAISKEAMEQKAIENGLLDKAYENAKEIISKLIDTSIAEELEYTVTFQ